MMPEQSVSVACRLLDELVDDAAARLPASSRPPAPGQAVILNRLLAEFTDDAGSSRERGKGPG
jgi:hypothetical protein